MTVRRVAPPTAADLDAAWAVVSERLAPTPLLPAPALGDDVHLKLETLQPTGSFKVRGGLAALSRAGGEPVVTASAGNAGLGIAWAEAHALELAARGAAYVSSYNDTGMIAGQSTIGRELDAQLPGELTVACPCGGGSLASGLGLWAAARAGARVVGVEAERSPALSTALAAGKITPIEVGDTLADGLAGNIEPGAVTFELVRDHVAAVASVSEHQIEEAIRFLARAHGIVAEGAGAAAVAGVMAGRMERGPGALVVVVTGRNIELARLAAVLGAA